MRHHFYLELTASYKTGGVEFLAARTSAGDSRTANPAVATAWVLRHRLMAEYAVAGTGLKPYVFVELTQTLNAPETVGNYLEKVAVRWVRNTPSTNVRRSNSTTRFDYKISDEPVFDDFPTVTHLLERENHHIIGLEYGYKF